MYFSDRRLHESSAYLPKLQRCSLLRYRSPTLQRVPTHRVFELLRDHSPYQDQAQAVPANGVWRSIYWRGRAIRHNVRINHHYLSQHHIPVLDVGRGSCWCVAQNAPRSRRHVESDIQAKVEYASVVFPKVQYISAHSQFFRQLL